MINKTRHAVTFTIVAHEDAHAAELDEHASGTWDRMFADSDRAGRVGVPRIVSSKPHPTMTRHIIHTYEGVMWD
ncbi:hypothetical protein AB4Z09_24390 [Rhodococcus sp. TAF43]|uniref:hypothetical protein n=1 Tax=Rhodococcus sp. TAF43 TaxID=3237483 RepID=UPI003F961E47